MLCIELGERLPANKTFTTPPPAPHTALPLSNAKQSTTQHNTTNQTKKERGGQCKGKEASKSSLLLRLCFPFSFFVLFCFVGFLRLRGLISDRFGSRPIHSGILNIGHVVMHSNDGKEEEVYVGMNL